jgi:ABC-type uncharacterized transport system permease subunit
MQTYFFAVAAVLYAVCAFLPARQGTLVSAVTALAWIAQGITLWFDLMAPGVLRIGFAAMLSAALWISVGAYWVENRNFGLDSLRRILMPCAAAVMVLAAVFPGSLILLEGKSQMFGWHIGIAILAYSTMTIAAFHAILMALQESRLHTRSERKGFFGNALDQLPALLTMEKLLFRLIGFGFVLLSLTVLSGIVFSEELFGLPLRFDHKSVFALLSWLLFAALLAGRHWRGWRGKTALSFTLAGFATLLLAYVGSRFVLEVILHRGLA